MKTFKDCAALVKELNNIADLGQMSFEVWNAEVNYKTEDLPEHLLGIAKGNRYNSNKSVPAIRLKQWNACSYGVGNMLEVATIECQVAYQRLKDLIEEIKSKELYSFGKSYDVIERILLDTSKAA